jgi:DNA-binding response OmpR family regulator
MTDQPRVLLIEDDASTAEMLSDFLELEGFELTAMGSALGAADRVRRERPDAILLDLQLPYRSGVSLLAELKATPETASIPVIICSGMIGSLTPARAAQAAAVLEKPLDLRRLLAAVTAAVTQPERRAG